MVCSLSRRYISDLALRLLQNFTHSLETFDSDSSPAVGARIVGDSSP